MNSMSPRAHRHPAFLEAKLARLSEPHVAPLNALVEDIRAGTGGEVPWFDPESGGVNARALFLFEAPGARSTGPKGPRTTAGSGLISEDNDDPSAQRMWELSRQAGLDRRGYLAWNVVPWYIGFATRIRAATQNDAAEAQPYLERLVNLLPRLRVVVTFGDVPLRCWMRYLHRPDAPVLPTLAAPHPSGRVLNKWPAKREEIAAALGKAAAIIAGSDGR